MARNSEKAQSMLFRFRAAQAAESGFLLPSASQRRPKALQSITSVPVAEKWRGQIVKEVSRKLTKIQDLSLSDYQIRDLNDELNRLMKEKWGWERRIRDLGGPNYMRSGVQVDVEGREVAGGSGGKGYRYYGRARELPGVKELFESRRPRMEGEGKKGKSGAGENVPKGKLDAAYFGYGDEDDLDVLRYERKREREAVERVEAMQDEERKGDGEDEDGDGAWEPLPGDKGDGVPWRLPTQEEVRLELMDRRKRTLLDKIG